MEDQVSNNKRIAQNTIFLYFRMIIVMIVTFYTTRITLQILGVEDFGIQNVVGSIVSFMNVIKGTMTSATQRFFAYALGANNIDLYKNNFRAFLLIFSILSIIVIVLAECIGPLVISSYLKIPESRVYAAQWVFQFTIITFVCNLMMNPFSSSIIAHEKMKFYAYISLYEVIAKLVVVYLLYISTFDKLISLSILHSFVDVTVLFIYIIYCIRSFEGCVIGFYHDKKVINELLRYTGWNLLGSLSSTLNISGMSIVINIFYGPIVNAAKAIADKINSVVVSFSNNFYLAVSPQIVKQYAADNRQKTLNLVYSSSKMSFFLLYVLSFPLLLLMEPILYIWLGHNQTTDEMIIFSRLMLIFSLINVLEQPLSMIIRATGEIKKYQIMVGLLTLSSVPLAIIFSILKLPSYFCIMSLIISYLLAHLVRLYITHNQVGLDLYIYYKKVILPILFVIVFSTTLIVPISLSIRYTEFSVITIILFILYFIITCIIIYSIGISKDERKKINRYIYLRMNNNRTSENEE